MYWLLFLILIESANSLYCLEGTNCEHNNQCDRCEGAACVRVARLPRKLIYISDMARTTRPTKSFLDQLLKTDEKVNFHVSNVQIALTCLPEIANGFDADPEGCRTDSLNLLRTCICSGYDYCNRSACNLVAHYTICISILIILLGSLI